MYKDGWYGDRTDDERIALADQILNVLETADVDTKGYTGNTLAQAINDLYDQDAGDSVLFFLLIHQFLNPFPVSGKKGQPHFEKILTEQHAPLLFIESGQLCPLEGKRNSGKISLEKKAFRLGQIFSTASMAAGEPVIAGHAFLHIRYDPVKASGGAVVHCEDTGGTEGPRAGAAHGGGLFGHKSQGFPVTVFFVPLLKVTRTFSVAVLPEKLLLAVRVRVLEFAESFRERRPLRLTAFLI